MVLYVVSVSYMRYLFFFVAASFVDVVDFYLLSLMCQCVCVCVMPTIFRLSLVDMLRTHLFSLAVINLVSCVDRARVCCCRFFKFTTFCLV